MEINTNEHCAFCNAELDLNNKNNQWEIVCINCWEIYDNYNS